MAKKNAQINIYIYNYDILHGYKELRSPQTFHDFLFWFLFLNMQIQRLVWPTAMWLDSDGEPWEIYRRIYFMERAINQELVLISGCTTGFLCLDPHLTSCWALKRKLEPFGLGAHNTHECSEMLNLLQVGSWPHWLQITESAMSGGNRLWQRYMRWSGDQTNTIVRLSCQSEAS